MMKPHASGAPPVRATSIWGLVLVLVAVAFWRTLSPERSARAVRRVLASRPANTSELQHLQTLRDAIARERAALLRLRSDFERRNVFATSLPPEPARDGTPSALSGAGRAPVVPPAPAEGAAEDTGGGDDDTAPTLVADLGRAPPTRDLDVGAQDDVSDDECAVVLSPIAARAGLGTQTEHIWAQLSLAKAIPGACVALPPLVADHELPVPRLIPFHEVFNVGRLASAGLRFAPLSACAHTGVARVFDDAFGDARSVAQYAAYAADSRPVLAQKTKLVSNNTAPARFLPAPAGPADQAAHVLAARPPSAGRYCVGLGRLVAGAPADAEVAARFEPAPKVAAFVADRFPAMTDALFVELRWNKAHCAGARTAPATVCLFGDAIASQEEYAGAVRMLAENVRAKQIYLSFPAHVPEDVLAYFAKHLPTMDPVVLQLEGDEFAANVIERELAIKAMAFVPDGGAWGATVQTLRKYRNPAQYVESMNSYEMLKQFKDSSPQPGAAPESAKDPKTSAEGEGSVATADEAAPVEPETPVEGEAPVVQGASAKPQDGAEGEAEVEGEGDAETVQESSVIPVEAR